MSLIDNIINSASKLSTVLPELGNQEKVSVLDDAIPALLLPYRMETRFHQKEYKLIYIIERFPELPKDPGGIGGGLFPIDTGIDLNPGRNPEIPVEDTPRISLKLVGDLNNVNLALKFSIGQVGDIEGIDIFNAESLEQMQNLLQNVSRYLLVSKDAKNTLESAAQRLQNTTRFSNEGIDTALKNISIWNPKISDYQLDITSLLERLVSNVESFRLDNSVQYPGAEAQFSTFIVHLQTLASSIALATETGLNAVAYIDFLVDLSRDINIALAIATRLHSIEEPQIAEIQDLFNALGNQLPGLQGATNAVVAGLETQKATLEAAKIVAADMLQIAQDLNTKVASLPILPGDTKLPQLPIYDRYEVIELRWELLVRVYPDELEIDTHEPELTDEEYRDGKLFWEAVWFDPTDREKGLEAWRPVVEAYGRPRAAWIIKATTPTNIVIDLTLFEIPDVIVNTVSTTLPDPQIDAGIEYWNTIWNGNGSKEIYEQAWAQINGQYGTPLSKVIVYATRPVNLDQRGLKKATDFLLFENPLFIKFLPPEYPTKTVIEERVKEIFTVQKIPDQAADPVFPLQERREDSWTRAPLVRVLPDRFTVITQHASEGRMEYVGNNISNEPLAVGLDPNFQDDRPIDAPIETYFEGEEILNGQVDEDFEGIEESMPQIEPAIKWMTDFNEAERIGMGIRINLGTEKPDGFEKVFVLGLKTNGGNPAEVGKNAIEELFTSLHYTGVGMSILKQGVPTNNTSDEDAAFNSPDIGAEESYKNELTGPLFSVKQDPVNKSDGQWLAEQLGIAHQTIFNIDNANNFDVSNAIAMNQALVSGTLTPFAEQLLGKQFVDKANPDSALLLLDELRDYFTENVSGRGFIPPIRVDQQPYGILATTAHSKWVSSSSDPSFHSAIRPVLQSFHSSWNDMQNQFVQQIDRDIKVTGINQQTHPVEYAEKELELGQARFMNLLGLNPTSIEWYQQLGFSQGPSGVQLAELFAQVSHYNLDRSNRHLLTNELGIPANLANASLIDDLQWFSENQRLKGGIVDKLDAEGNYLTHLLENRNYIHLLLEASLPTIRTQDYHKALDSNATSFNFPNSLLYLYLRHSLLNQYFDSSMRVLDTVANHPNNLFGTNIRTNLNLFKSSGFTNADTIETQWDHLLKDFSGYSLKAGYNFSNYNHLAQYLRETYNTTDLLAEKSHLLEVRKAMEILSSVPSKNLERDFLEHMDLCSYRFDAWQNGLVNHRLQKQRTENRSGVYLGGFSWVENLTPDDSLIKVPEEEIPEDINPEDRDLHYDPKNMGMLLAPSSAHAVAASVMRNAFVSHYEGNSKSKVAVNLSSERIRLARQIIEGIKQGQSLAALLGYRFERHLIERSLKDNLNLEQHLYEIRKAYPLADITNKEDSENEGDLKESISAINVVDGLALFEQSRDQEVNFTTWLATFDATTQTVITECVDVLANAVDAISDVAVSEAVFHSIQGNTARAKAFTDALAKNGQMPLPEAFEIKNNGLTITHTLGVSFPPIRENENTIAANDANKLRSPRSIGEPSLDQWLDGILPNRNNIRLEVNYEGLTEPQVWTAEMLSLYPIDLLYLVRPELRDDAGALPTYVRHLVRCKNELAESTNISVDFAGKGLLSGEGENLNRVSFAELELALEKINLLIGKGKPMTNEHFQRYDAPVPTENANSLFLNNPKGYDIEHYRERVNLLIEADFFVVENELDILNDGLSSVLNAVPSTGLDVIDLTLDPSNPLFDNLPDINLPDLVPAAQCDLPFRGLGVLVDELNTLTQSFTSNPIKRASIANSIKDRLLAVWKFGFDSALPGNLSDDADERHNELYKIARVVIKELSPKIEKARELIALNTEDDPATTYSKLEEAVGLISTYNFKLFPLFQISNQNEVNQGVTGTKVYKPIEGEDPDLPEQYTGDELELLMQDWLSDVSRMREAVAIMDDAMLFAENIADEEPTFSLNPIQYPAENNENFWLGMEFPSTAEIEEGKKSLVLYGDKPTSGDWCALVIDEWNETIPDKHRNVAATFHYDQPNAKAPNCMLLAITPEETGQWQWSDLVDTLDETLEMAKKRAVEPEHLDQYKKEGNYLFTKIFPAIAAPIVDAERGFSLDLAANNEEEFYRKKVFATDSGLTLADSESLLGDEDREKDESETGGNGGFSVQIGREVLGE